MKLLLFLASTLFLKRTDAYSYAHDHSKDCEYWANRGFCTASNSSLRTQELCPVSCGLLPSLVDDADISCEAWREEGECDKNPIAMTKTCPLSCGHASNVCVDLNKNCAAWKHEGQCESNSDYMRNNCAASCFCKRRCFDKDASCARWAKDGACESNPSFAMLHCPVSCNVCKSHTEILEDNEEVKCPLWARSGECERNPANMAKECGYSCNVGEVVCGDLRSFDECQSWKKEGRCDEEYMKQFCAGTCGVCSRLENFYDKALRNEEEHDEL